MPLPSYQTVPLPSFSAIPPNAAAGHSAEYERVLNLLHEVDERVAELYPQLSDHWLQSELYAFLHVKDELVSRVKKRATRKLSVAAGAAERRKDLRVSTSSTTAAAAAAVAATALTSPDSGATEIAKGNVPQTPANEAIAAITPARPNKSSNKGKSSVASNKQRVSAVLKEMAGEEVDNNTVAVTDSHLTETEEASAAAVSTSGEREEEAKEAEVISPLPQVARTTSTTGGAKGGRTAAPSITSKQRTDSRRLTATHSSSSNAAANPSSIPVFTATAAPAGRSNGGKKTAVPAFARGNTRGVRAGVELPGSGHTARVLQEEHAELAMKLDELQTRHKQLADKQDKYIKKREREEDDNKRKRAEQEAAAVAAQLTTAIEEQPAAAGSVIADTVSDNGAEAIRPPLSPGRLVPLAQQDGPTSPRSPRHASNSSLSNTLSPLSSSRPVRPNSPSLPPLSSANLSPLTSRVAAAPLSARDQILQPATQYNDEAQRGTVCSGLLLCAPTPRLLLRPSTQETDERQTEKPLEDATQTVEQPAEIDSIAMEQSVDELQSDQQAAVSDVNQAEPTQSTAEAEARASALQESSTQLVSTTIRPSSRSVDQLTVDVLSATAPLPTAPINNRPPTSSSLSATSSSASSRSSSPLAGTATPRTLRPSTAEMSNTAAAAVSSPPTPSARSRMVHRAGQPFGGGLSVVPTSPVGLPPPPASARSRATSGETGGKAAYEESFPVAGMGSRRASIQREEAAVVAETVKGLGQPRREPWGGGCGGGGRGAHQEGALDGSITRHREAQEARCRQHCGRQCGRGAGAAEAQVA